MSISDLSYLVDSLNRYYYETCDLYRQNQDSAPTGSAECEGDCPAKNACPVVSHDGNIFYPVNNITYRI